MRTVIDVQNLCKNYGGLSTVNSVTFEDSEGVIFGMVDPNSAGKTITIECLEGLRRQVRTDGCTVFHTTHFMEEAEHLCDRVAIMDHGRIIALDSPEAMICSLGMEKRLVFKLPEGQTVPALEELPAVERVERSGSRLIVFGQGERFATSVVYALEDTGTQFLDMRTEQPNLEDVFPALTWRELRE